MTDAAWEADATVFCVLDVDPRFPVIFPLEFRWSSVGIPLFPVGHQVYSWRIHHTAALGGTDVTEDASIKSGRVGSLISS